MLCDMAGAPVLGCAGKSQETERLGHAKPLEPADGRPGRGKQDHEHRRGGRRVRARALQFVDHSQCNGNMPGSSERLA